MMRKLSISVLALLLFFAGWAQTVTQVGTGEYVTAYLKSDGTVGFYSQNSITPTIQTHVGLDSIVMLAGGQYHVEALDQRGRVYKLGNQGSPTWNEEAYLDQFDVPFNNNFYITGFYQCNVSIRNPDSTVWYWGISDPMNYSATEPITKPIALTMPSGKKMKKVLAGTNIGFGDATTFIIGLASDGTLWRWGKKVGTAGLTTPTQIVITGETVLDFGIASFYGVIASTASSKLYSCGGFDTRYVGAASHSASVTDITSRWTSAGLDFPVKEIGSGTWTVHIIDANNDMFGSGSDAMGNVGIGFEKPNMKTASGSDGVWGIDIAQNGAYMQAPVQIPGKFKNIEAGTTIVFYNYVQDLFGNWYSWGRNKSFNLANGTSLGPYAGWGGTGDYATYPNAKDIPMPKKVFPLTTNYTLVNFNAQDDPPPVVSAGIDQYVASSTATLTGVVHQQEFTISSYSWTKISGPAGQTITSPMSLTTTVTGLKTGVYVFQLTVTNSNGQSSSAQVTLDVVEYIHKDTTVSGWLCRISYPANYNPIDSCEMFLISHGLGQVSGSINYAQDYGPHYWFNNGMSPSITLGNGIHYPVYVYIQPTTAYARPWSTFNTVYTAMVSRFNPKKKARHAMGFSMGGWMWNTFVSYKPTSNDYSYYLKLTTVVNIQGVRPEDQYDATLLYPQKMGNVAKYTGYFKHLGFEQVLDGRNIDGLTKNMNDSLAGSAFFYWTNFGSSGHSNFNDFYNPNQRNWTLTNADVQLSNGSAVNTIPIPYGLNIYEWMIKQGDTAIYAYSSATLSVNAGVDVDVYMPTNSYTLAGYGTGYTSVTWSKIQDPSARTWVGNPQTPSSATSIVSNLSVGVYKYRLAATDGITTLYDTMELRVHNQISQACNTAPKVSYNIPYDMGQGAGYLYYSNILTQYPNLKGGDTLFVDGSLGAYSFIQFTNVQGDSCNPIVIASKNAPVYVYGNGANMLSITNSRYFKLTTIIPGARFGWYLDGQDVAENGNGIAMSGTISDFTVEKVYLRDASAGVIAKTNRDTTNSLTWYGNWWIKNAIFREIKIQSVGGEGMYIGHTFALESLGDVTIRPVAYNGLTINNCITDSTGWDGIQVANAHNYAVYNDTSYWAGLSGISSQQAGIILGGYANGYANNNVIKYAASAGYQVFGFDTVKITNSYIDSCGWFAAGGTEPAVYVNDNLSASIGSPGPGLLLIFEDNCIRQPSSYTLNSGNAAGIRVVNSNGTMRPSFIRRNKIYDNFYSRTLGNLIISGVSTTLADNTLEDCLSQILTPKKRVRIKRIH